MQSIDLAAWVFGFGQREKDLGFLAAWLREGKQRGRRRQGSWAVWVESEPKKKRKRQCG